MPIYEFKCDCCNKIHEFDLKMSKYNKKQICPKCGKRMDRTFSSLHIIPGILNRNNIPEE